MLLKTVIIPIAVITAVPQMRHNPDGTNDPIKSENSSDMPSTAALMRLMTDIDSRGIFIPLLQ